MKKPRFSQRLNRFIFGQNLFAPLEKRVLTLVAFMAFCIGIIGNTSNIILGFDFRLIILTGIATIFLLWVFLKTRKARNIENIATSFFIFVVITIILLWFGSGGYDGNTVSLAIASFFICYMVLPEKQKNYAAIVFMSLIPSLIVLQYFIPSIVIQYSDPLQRFVDLSVGNFLYVLMIYLFLRIIKNNYSFEQKRTAIRNKLLDTLNKKLDEKNHEISRQNDLLRQGEERYYSIFNNSPNIMFIHQDFRFVLINEEGLNFFGIPLYQIKGESIFTLAPKNQHEELRNRVGARTEIGSKEVYEIVLSNRAGEDVLFMVSSTLFLYEGRPASLSTLTDISATKKLEEKRIRRLQFENSLMQFSNDQLLHSHPEEKLFNDLLARIGDFFQAEFAQTVMVSRNEGLNLPVSFLFEAGENESHFDCSFLYKEFIDLFNSDLTRNRVLHDDSDGDRLLKRIIDDCSIKSYLLTSISNEFRVIGFIGVFSKSSKKVWDEEELSIFQLVASFISNAVTRMEKHAESQNSERQYRAIFESAGDAILIFEPEDELILEANEKALQLYGFAYNEFIGMSLKSISQNIVRGELQISNTLQNGEYHNFNTIQYKKDGTPMDLLINAAVIQFRGQTAIISINRDITSIKKAEHALKLNEERLRLVLESTRDGIWDWRVDNSTTYFSPSYYLMLGYEPDEFQPTYQSWKKLVHPDDLHSADSIMYEHPETDFYTTEFRMQSKSGEWIWIYNRAKVIERDASGAPARIVGSHTDISLKKAYEQQLNYARILISQIMDAIPSAIISFDNELRIRHTNLEVEKLFGEDESHSVYLFQRYPRLYFINDLLQVSFSENTRIHEVLPYKDNYANIKYMDVLIIPLEGFEQNRVLVVTDITERRKLETLIVQSEKMHSVSNLAAGMAHELNNPLGTISQGCQNLLRRIDKSFPKNIEVAQTLGLNLEQYNNYLETRQIFEIINSMKTAAGRASDIISNMLKFSKRNDELKTSYSIEKLIDVAIDIAYNDYDLAKKHDIMAVQIIKDIQPNLPTLAVTVSEIEQVIFNLIRNAIQAFHQKEFSPGERPTIIIRAFIENVYIRVEVEDNGAGIPSNLLNHVFEPFFTTKDPGEGTGLGLSVCYTIVSDNHSGQIFVESEHGMGAKFIFRLPLI